MAIIEIILDVFAEEMQLVLSQFEMITTLTGFQRQMGSVCVQTTCSLQKNLCRALHCMSKTYHKYVTCLLIWLA